MAYINEKGQEVLSPETRVLRVPFTVRELTVFDRVRMMLEEKYASENDDFESEEDANDFGPDEEFDGDISSVESPAQFYDRVMMEPDPPREPDLKSEQEPSEKEPEATE